MKYVAKQFTGFTVLTLVMSVMPMAGVNADEYCCYHSGQIWMDSGSARQVRVVRSEPVQPVVDVVNPWRTTKKNIMRHRRQTYSPSMNFYNRPTGYGNSLYARELVPLGLHGPVNTYLLGRGTGWPMSPMPWGW